MPQACEETRFLTILCTVPLRPQLPLRSFTEASLQETKKPLGYGAERRTQRTLIDFIDSGLDSQSLKPDFLGSVRQGIAATGHRGHGAFQLGGAAVVEMGMHIVRLAQRRNAELASIAVFAGHLLAALVGIQMQAATRSVNALRRAASSMRFRSSLKYFARDGWSKRILR